MKDETKSKLKKYGKRAGFGVALVSLFLLGVGVGACSARKAVGSSAEDCAPFSLMPKRAGHLDPSGFASFDDSDDNLLRDSIGGHYYISQVDNDIVCPARDFYDTYLLKDLPRGLYRVSISHAISNDWNGYYMTINDHAWSSASSGFYGSSFNFPLTDVLDWASMTSSGDSYVGYFSVSGVFDNLLLTCLNNASIKVSLIDSNNIPASHLVSFPDNYNPLIGFGTPSDGLIGQLAGNTTSPFRLDLYFRAGGQIFKRIDFYFLPMQGTEYVSSLNSSGTPSVFTGSGFVYASMINYIAYDGTTFLAWRAIFGTKSDGTLYLRNFGEWASKQYQTIDVFDYTPVYGQSGVSPNLDQIGILELRTASGVPTPIIGGDGNADVFSLLTTGFNSVAGLMNIQILPFLTLGTLIFVPLVVMVIFAILKVLNK